ncbi:MAG: type I methionyl aminopeptidase [Patescibacteria group bacterium]
MKREKIAIKTPEQVAIMHHGGKILANVMGQLIAAVKPGVTELAIDQLAEKLIRAQGGEPGFKRVEGYTYTICISTNDVVVHGIPGNYAFKPGDIVGIDCGVYYKGFHTDMSESTIVPDEGFIPAESSVKFLNLGKQALDEAIKVATIGNHIGDISKTIQDIVQKKGGYSIVRSLIGHGVGRELHEAPEVPGYLVGKIENTPLLREGMTIAVEVIYNMGGAEVVLDHDGWTIRSEDASLAGLFERTIAITKQGTMLLT